MINSLRECVSNDLNWNTQQSEIVNEQEKNEEGKCIDRKIDFTHYLPQEIIREIFAYLNALDLGRCLLVSKSWKKLASHEELWNVLPPKMAFGKEQWEKYFGDVGNVPSFPKEIHKILNSPCPFWPGKKVEETHILVLVPKTINGVPLNLTTLEQIVKTPKEGHATQFRYLWDTVFKENSHQMTISHWALMTKDILPKSIDIPFTAQKALITDYSKNAGVDYEVVNMLDAAICVLMHYIRYKERLCDAMNIMNISFTRCQEMDSSYHDQIAIGAFNTDGLYIGTCFKGLGVMAMRKFF